MHDEARLAALRGQAERLRAAEALGRSDLTRRLFDFLVACSERRETPREIDIAVEVFGRDQNFDVSQDASVRVYIHRLRRKLDDFYEGAGRDQPVRLTIPKGEYRLDVVPQRAAAEAPSAEAPPPRRRWAALAAGLFILLVLANGLAWMLLRPASRPDPLADIRATVTWSGVIADERPIILAVGDYYIFGDTDGGLAVQRLVREFSINSRENLYEFLLNNPELMGRYVDIGLRYLPISVAYAMQKVLPVLGKPGTSMDRIRVVLASDLTPEMMKTAHIVYIGYLSGLGILRDPVFAGSRYAIGATYDEIVDRESGELYVSQINGFEGVTGANRDYGLFSTFTGPTGNRLVIISGTRDVAIRQLAEDVTDADTLTDLEQSTGAEAFEALYRVEAMQQFNMDAALVAATPLDTARIWSGTQDLRFPAQ